MTLAKTLTLSAAALAVSVTALSAAVPAHGRLEFDVMREGSDIGDITYQFHSVGDTTSVKIRTDIAVRLPLIGTVMYKFKQDSIEKWKAGRLASVQARTDDDGAESAVTKGETDLIPASLWNKDLVEQDELLNTINGSTVAIQVDMIGAETVDARGGEVAATHYRVSGGLQRDLWYDADGVLVRVSFTAKDGSNVAYVLR